MDKKAGTQNRKKVNKNYIVKQCKHCFICFSTSEGSSKECCSSYCELLDKKIVCEWCGKEFYQKSVHYQRRFCSHSCAAKSRNEPRKRQGPKVNSRYVVKQCKYCGICFSTHKDKNNEYCSIHCENMDKYKCVMCGKPIAFAVKGAVNKYCSYTCMNKDKEAPTYFCKNCGKEYKPKSSDRINYCSRECYFESIKVEYVDGYVEGSSCRVYFNKCLYCGKIKVSERAGKYCSDKCYRADSKEETRERSRNRNMELTDWDRVRTCAECGKKFTKESYGKKGLRCFCSEECARSANRRIRKNLKYKRRARVKEALVDRGITIEKLFVRDHGRCAICGRKLKISDVVPSKYAPTVDHIIPLSRGGKHAWYNVQLACFLCNSMKGDRSHGNGNRMMLPIKWLYVERGV